MIQDIDDQLKLLELKANKNNETIYQILFRHAGVAIEYFNHKKAGLEPYNEDIVTRIHMRREWLESGLTVYTYYPSLSDALAGEFERLNANAKA